jgi:tetratricopeptide (TPR) repeat protein
MLICVIAPSTGSILLAQTVDRNPLEVDTEDPLIPKPPVSRPLSPLEIYNIEQTSEELNKQANELIKFGSDETAFKLWYREIRLRRALGSLSEVKALLRVGKIAWEKNRKSDVQNITRRLTTIDDENINSRDLVFLNALANAYQSVGNPNRAFSVYERLLTLARQNKDVNGEEEILNNVGQMYLARFEYAKAAQIYEQLLALARSQGDSLQQISHLRQLADIYNQELQPSNAIEIKKQLLETYLNDRQIKELIGMQISLGGDYQLLDRPEEAKENYQKAFNIAIAEGYFGLASDALQKLGDLYRAYDQKEQAIDLYQKLIQIQQESYDFYGLMNTYDRLGQIYLDKKDWDLSLKAFEKGLEIARSLQYQESYFLEKINLVIQSEKKQ